MALLDTSSPDAYRERTPQTAGIQYDKFRIKDFFAGL
jgi:hypothetical protein